jgi:hypothetical protein
MLVQTARDAYRFEAQLPVGKTAKQAVTEERDLTSTALQTDSADEQVRLFLQSPVVGDKVKAGLRKAQGLRWEWARAQREVGERRRQLQAVAEDQGRPQANLREVPQSSPLHKRYLDKLGQQEDEVEKYRAEVKRLQGQEHARRKALDDFLAALSADLYQPPDAPRAPAPALKLRLSPSRGGDRQARRGLPVNETTEWH